MLFGLLLVIRLALHGLARYLLPIQYQFSLEHAAAVCSLRLQIGQRWLLYYLFPCCQAGFCWSFEKIGIDVVFKWY